MNRLLIDARCITAKPCGVRKVAELYLQHTPTNSTIIVLVNKSSPVEELNERNVSIVKAHNIFNRFNLFTDLILISLLVIVYRPSHFVSLHSFLPVISLLPKKSIFVFHDHFSAFNKDFFEDRKKTKAFASAFFKLLTFFSTWRATKIIVPSNFVRNELVSKIPSIKRKISICENPVQLDSVKTKHKAIPNRQKVFLFVGNSRKYKGLDLLLEAWVQFSKEKKDIQSYKLIIVTNEPEQKLDEKFHYKISSSVEIFSRVNTKQLNDLRNRTSAFIIPSREEGFGLPVIESFLWNKPILLSDIPVFNEITASLPPQNFIWFSPHNRSEFVDKLHHTCKLIDLDSNANPLTDNKIDTCLHVFSPNEASKRLFKIITEGNEQI